MFTDVDTVIAFGTVLRKAMEIASEHGTPYRKQEVYLAEGGDSDRLLPLDYGKVDILLRDGSEEQAKRIHAALTAEFGQISHSVSPYYQNEAKRWVIPFGIDRCRALCYAERVKKASA